MDHWNANFVKYCLCAILLALLLGCGDGFFLNYKASRPPRNDGLQFPDYPDKQNKKNISDSFVFAVIGDYGSDGKYEADVASLINSWNPNLILTVGDNNYPGGEDATIDANVGKYYHKFLANYSGNYGSGTTTMQFFPSLGNHDWDCLGCRRAPLPYLDYFSLYGNGRYYDFVRGNIHFYALDSDPREPDGVTADSTQALWLKERLAASNSEYNIVYFHHAPFSSGNSGNTVALQWPFKEWGASCVLSGHDHHYERFDVGGLPYIVNGVGGRSLYSVHLDSKSSVFRKYIDSQHFGALKSVVDSMQMVIQFYSTERVLLDQVIIPAKAVP